MRRPLARAAVTLLPAALLLPFGGTASAGTCVAYGTPPYLKLYRSDLHASGTFRCDGPAAGMTVTVCIEELGWGEQGEEVWWQMGCATATEGEAASSVSAAAEAGVPVYATWIRTTVTGANATGHTGTFATPRQFWFNCACYIG